MTELMDILPQWLDKSVNFILRSVGTLQKWLLLAKTVVISCHMINPVFNTVFANLSAIATISEVTKLQPCSRIEIRILLVSM